MGHRGFPSRKRWPFPGDAPVVVARKVAAAYRQALEMHAPEVCAEMDRAMRDFGQAWVMPRVRRFDLDDWLSVRDAADLANTEPDTLRRWRTRGRITGRRNAKGQWEYQARAVLAAGSAPRTRTRTAGGSDDG